MSFVWPDGERTIHFGPAADAVEMLGGPGYTLLTTPRARARHRGRGAAGAVHQVGRGRSTRSPEDCSAKCAATGSSRWAAGA